MNALHKEIPFRRIKGLVRFMRRGLESTASLIPMAIADYDTKTPQLGGVALKKTHRKWPISYRSVGPAALVIDLLIIQACGITSGVLYNYFQFSSVGDPVIDFATSTVVSVVFIALLKTRDLYDPAELLDFRGQLRDVSTAWLSVFLFFFGVLFTFKIGGSFSRGAIFSFGASGLFLLLFSRLVYRTVLHRGLTEEKFAGRRAVLITDTAIELKRVGGLGPAEAWVSTPAPLYAAVRPKRR